MNFFALLFNFFNIENTHVRHFPNSQDFSVQIWHNKIRIAKNADLNWAKFWKRGKNIK